jgi:hypothetical protein
MEQLKKAPYAILGTGDLAMQKAKGLFGKAVSLATNDRPDVTRVYGDLADRGAGVVKRVQRSKPAKRAVEGTKQASRQLKGAATSIRKALGFEEQQKRTTRKAS